MEYLNSQLLEKYSKCVKKNKYFQQKKGKVQEIKNGSNR